MSKNLFIYYIPLSNFNEILPFSHAEAMCEKLSTEAALYTSETLEGSRVNELV